MRNFNAPKIFALIAAAVVVVTACARQEETRAQVYGSPISEFFEIETLGAAELREQFKKAEEDAVTCMREEGFEYSPYSEDGLVYRTHDDFFFRTDNGVFIYNVDEGSFRGTDERYFYTAAGESGSREFIEKYGFGKTTTAFLQEAVGSDLVGSSRVELPVDPNLEYAASLSDSEREAFVIALYGGQGREWDLTEDEEASLTLEELAELEETNFEDTGNLGCRSGHHALTAEVVIYKLQPEFVEEITAMEHQVLLDDGLAEREDEVSACVAGKGLSFYGFTPEGYDNEVEVLFAQDLREIEEEYLSAWKDLNGELLQDEDAKIEDFQIPELSDDAKAKLGVLQKKEIELAEVVWECGGGIDDTNKLIAEVRADLEKDFIEKNKDRLTDIKEQIKAAE